MCFIGFHGTRVGVRESLSSGLRIVPGTGWDNCFGPGFYIAKELSGAHIYGSGIAAQYNENVDIWKIFSTKSLSSYPHKMYSVGNITDLVKNDKQNDHYIWLAQKGAPTEIKFNPIGYRCLRIELYKENVKPFINLVNEVADWGDIAAEF